MRILHTAASYSPSLDGVAEVVRNISERLARRGHEVHVATAAFDSGNSDQSVRGVQIHRFSAKGNLTFGMQGEIQKYREFVRSGDWDVMVNHCVQVWTTDALLEEIGSYPWPCVLVTHGLSVDNPAFSGYYAEFPRRLCGYTKWIRVSDVSEEKLFAPRSNLPMPPVITNGVDMEEWTRPPLNLRRKWGIGQKPWVVNVSNHNPLKNHRAFFQLADLLGQHGAQFTLVGGTYAANRCGLGRVGISGGCAYECKLRSKLSMGTVSLRTNLRRQEVVSAIQEADIIVSTSKWEANSIVLLESMAAGTPWVSFDVGSASENAGGIVVRDLEEMVGLVKELWWDPGRREALGRAGRERAVSKHDWDALVDQYEQVYESMVGSGVETCAR